MNLALFTRPGVISSLQIMVRWLISVKILTPHSVSRLKPPRTENTPKFAVSHAKSTSADSESTFTHKPVRIVRILESGQAQSSVGRMVISGRMADVCAELDRLAAREAALL